MANCCVCGVNVEREDAPVLGMGGAGNPRILCDGCDSLLETATRGRDYDEIKASVGELSKRLSVSDPDHVTFVTMNALMLEASERARAIKDGNYDFALDEVESDEGFDEIPEELQETEEDRAKDKADEEKMEKFNKFYNYVLYGAIAGFVIFFIWKLIDTFFLK